MFMLRAGGNRLGGGAASAQDGKRSGSSSNPRRCPPVPPTAAVGRAAREAIREAALSAATATAAPAPAAAAATTSAPPASLAAAAVSSVDPSSSSSSSSGAAHFGARTAAEALDAARGLLGGGTGRLPHLPLPPDAALPSLPSSLLPAPPSLEAATQAVAAQAGALQSALAAQQQHLASSASAAASSPGRLLEAAAAAAAGASASSPLRLSATTDNTSSEAAHFGARAVGEFAARVVQALSSLPDLPRGGPTLIGGAGGGAGGLPSRLGAAAHDLVADAAAAADALLRAASSLLPEQASAAPAAVRAAHAAAHAELSALAAGAAGARDALLALPQTGWGGHDFATLCAAFLAACAACAAVRPPRGPSPEASAADEGYSAAAYAPRPLLGNGGGEGAAAAAAALREPRLGYEYDPEAVRQYFSRRPIQTARRAAEVALEASGLAMALLRDRAAGKLEANAPLRARQARESVERLGPAFVKVAQAFSTRVDLLPPDYYREVQRLQDRVPPFPCEEARAAMAAAWGGGDGGLAGFEAGLPAGGLGGFGFGSGAGGDPDSPYVAEQEDAFARRATPAQKRARAAAAVDAVCARLSAKPVAAASLGQVYRATLSAAYGGGEVAIKVQRPGVLEGVCLDLLLVRRAAAWITLWREGEVSLPFAAAPSPPPSSSSSPPPPGGFNGKRTDWAALVDEWAGRFLREMDYTREAANARRAALQLAERGVTGVVIPEPIEALTTRQVLVLRWVDGERLAPSGSSSLMGVAGAAQDDDNGSNNAAVNPTGVRGVRTAASLAAAADTKAVCATLLNVYLTQLLETGELHADPHVGNLLRLPDGRVAILDWGLTQSVSAQQRAALLSYVAHLTSRDWPNVARDLQALGFIPEDAGDPAEMGLVEPLGRVLSQLSGGGGAAKLNVDAVLAELEDLGRDYPFRVPPYFALVLRAFSLIEGVALAADPDYSIVQECLPYVAKRLLGGSGIAALGSGDPVDRAAARQAEREVAARATALEAAAASAGEAFEPGAALELAVAELRGEDAVVRRALRNVLCGTGARVDPDRLATLAGAFGSFTTSASGLEGGASAAGGGGGGGGGGGAGGAGGRGASAPTPTLPAAVKDALVLAFSSRGTPLQDLLADELAAAADALSRDALGGALRAALGSPPALAAASALQSVPPGVRRALLPAPTPLELLARLRPAVELSEQDREALRAARGVLDLLQRVSGGGGGGAAAAAGFGGGFGGARLPSPGEAAAVFAALAELRPLAPSIAPGVAYVAERASRALASRVSQRAQEAWGGPQDGGLWGGGGLAARQEAEERAAAMAAVGFAPTLGGTYGGGDADAASWEQQQQQQQRQAAATATVAAAAGLGLVAAGPLLLLLAAPLAPLAAVGAMAAAAQQQQQEGRDASA